MQILLENCVFFHQIVYFSTKLYWPNQMKVGEADEKS